MSQEKILIDNLEYLSEIDSNKTSESIWLPKVAESIAIINNNTITNLSLVNLLIESIPDNLIRDKIMKSI